MFDVLHLCDMGCDIFIIVKTVKISEIYSFSLYQVSSIGRYCERRLMQCVWQCTDNMM